MQVKTSVGNILECESITSIPSPPRLYLHLINTSIETANKIFVEENQLPLQEYPAFTEVQSISQEGSARVKVSLRIEGT